MAVPVIDGADVFAGGTTTPITAADAAELTGTLVPLASVALTVTFNVDPVSELEGVYASLVSPAIGAHPAPDPSHRCHW